MLSHKQESILKALYPDKIIDKEAIMMSFKADDTIFRNMYDEKLICYASRNFNSNTIRLTESGIAHVEEIYSRERNNRSNKMHQWTNTIVAVLALITAIGALIVSIMQL